MDIHFFLQFVEMFAITRLKSASAKAKYKPYFLDVYLAIQGAFAGDPDFGSVPAEEQAEPISNLKIERPVGSTPGGRMTRDTMPAAMQLLLRRYEASDGQSGIPTELFRFAQDHPELLIDRSGNNLTPTNPWFNFYNPWPTQKEGQDWWPNDDRNNPTLKT